MSGQRCLACYREFCSRTRRRSRRPPIDPATIKVGDTYKAFSGDVFHVIGLTENRSLILQIDTTTDPTDVDVWDAAEFAELMKVKVPGRKRPPWDEELERLGGASPYGQLPDAWKMWKRSYLVALNSVSALERKISRTKTWDEPMRFFYEQA